MEIRVLRKGLDDRACEECGASAEVQLEAYDDPGRFAPLCIGCMVMELLRLRSLFQIRGRPAPAAGAGLPRGS